MRLPVFPRPVRVAGAAAVALLILVVSVVDPPSGGAEPWRLLGVPQDKWLHALAYAGLAGALAYAALAATAREVALVVVLAVAYGLGIEVIQFFLPLRAFDLADAAANATGAVLAGAGWALVGRRLR